MGPKIWWNRWMWVRIFMRSNLFVMRIVCCANKGPDLNEFRSQSEFAGHREL